MVSLYDLHERSSHSVSFGGRLIWFSLPALDHLFGTNQIEDAQEIRCQRQQDKELRLVGKRLGASLGRVEVELRDVEYPESSPAGGRYEAVQQPRHCIPYILVTYI
jgi:hypothetical protein